MPPVQTSALVGDPFIDRLHRNDAADQELRNAYNVLGPLIRELPSTDDLLLSDHAAAAWRVLRDRNPNLYLTYRAVVRQKCGAFVAQLIDIHIGPPTGCAGDEYPLRALSVCDLVDFDLPKLEPILGPWLMEKNLCMVHAKRGVGKTHLALGVSFAVASGGAYLSWRAPKPRGVLYLDGEMPAQLMQARLKELMSGNGAAPELLRVVTPDLQDKAMPDLGTSGGQKAVDALIDDQTALIVIDNLSCLVRSGGAENESESWTLVSEWALRHRRAGRAVVFVHHSGKSGAQRGTSKREDLLDVVICLRRPATYTETEGAVFTIEFEKARSLRGDDIAPIEARLETLPSGAQEWTYRAVQVVEQKTIRDLWNAGALTLMDIARELAMNKSTVHRQLERAMTAGELTRPYPALRGKKAP